MTPQDALVLSVIAYPILIILGVFITRLIFSIPAFLRLQKAQVKLLSEIAVKSGVEPDKISGILNESKIQP
jgi:hypothetical protein